MKKILAIFAILILLGTISATAIPIKIEKPKKTTITSETGNFEGEIGFFRDREWNKVGVLSGIFNQRNRFYRIEGDWEITEGRQADARGIINGFFVRNIVIGRITIDESGRKAPIIGFIRINEEEMTFSGRFMSLIGPALYFKGTFS